ncbi:hypothetical protein E4T56_gene20993 [Termitomyces sp. T112]|nr:hypothetical protein E4T56_gene20993 [Termitomyces sp. T112]
MPRLPPVTTPTRSLRENSSKILGRGTIVGSLAASTAASTPMGDNGENDWTAGDWLEMLVIDDTVEEKIDQTQDISRDIWLTLA